MRDSSILNIFERKVRKIILDFCKEINASTADLYIVMARKAACFVSALEKLSMISLNGDIISERVLDCNIDWSKINKVIIIDDVVISGTTLYEKINYIKNANPSINIKLYVLGINKDWFNDSILKQNGETYFANPIREFNNSECIRLSGDIVRMLAAFPLPYNIDFPIYNTIRIGENDFNQLQSIPGWQVAEVSSFPYTTNGVFNHTYIPETEILTYCGLLFTTNFIKQSLLKIRTYGTARTDKQHGIYRLTIVPMIIMPPISLEDLNILFREIAIEKYSSINNMLCTPSAKLRFVQFVLSDILARQFIAEVNYLLGKRIIIDRDYSTLRYLFPSSIIEDVICIANHFNGRASQPTIREINNNAKGIHVAEILDIHKALIDDFLKLYYEQELVSRRLVKKLGASAFNEKENRNVIGRLNRGISIDELSKKLSGLSPALQQKFISAFLDSAIDEGIIVPITIYDAEKKLVYRAFRHGEDVQFGQQEERLCYEMINAFSLRVNRSNFPKLWIEKLIVLLFQLGEGRIFEPLQTNISPYAHISDFDQIDIASVRYYLQGPVVVKTPRSKVLERPYLEYSDKADWITSVMTNSVQSPLTLNSSGLYEFDHQKYLQISSGENEIVVDAPKARFARSIGRLFGQLLSNESKGVRPCITGDELIMLTSSLESSSIIGALAAEINICLNSANAVFIN